MYRSQTSTYSKIMILSFGRMFSAVMAWCLSMVSMTAETTMMPSLSNASSPFRGKILNDHYNGNTWVSYPHVENPASLDQDPFGRLLVAEAHRFNNGTPDLRSNRHMIQDDYKSKSVGDRLKIYQKYQHIKPMDWYTEHSERLVLLEDKDGNGVADHRTLYADGFDDPLDGIGFSVLAERNATYFTCIPALRKLIDADGDGRADSNDKILDGFGVRISFTGHDLHGITRGPDGRLYFSVGDRGYQVVDDNGKVHQESGRGAVFRCNSDGSGFEVFAYGLRNPQELAFDDHGNLFTFDNDGDIQDSARVVYVLKYSDSGWDMSHQSAHQYVRDLDWGDFHVAKSVWVGEKMYDVFNPDSPQWVHPPVGHAGEGPSGVIRMTGNSVPASLRNSFLLTDYRGAATRSQTIAIKLRSSGAGFQVSKVEPFIEGLAASDVELGYDGNIYFADYGGGWRVNENGSIQVLFPIDEQLKSNGEEVARMFEKGFEELSTSKLVTFLSHPDQRVRQESQFTLVKREEFSSFIEILQKDGEFSISSLHAVWGLGQLVRSGNQQISPILLQALNSPHEEVRANVARVIGDAQIESGREALLEALKDPSARVVSLSAIALGEICKVGDEEASTAILEVAAGNRGAEFDVTLRHALLSGLHRLALPEFLGALSKSPSYEQRLLAVLALRRMEHKLLGSFLNDPHEIIRHEAIRAIYDTKALLSSAGSALQSISLSNLPYYLQVRVAGACFRLGTEVGASNLIRHASNASLEPDVRLYALRALERWNNPPQFDAVLGHHRPLDPSPFDLTIHSSKHASDFLTFLANEMNPEIASLGTEVAKILGISLNPKLLRQQVTDIDLDPQVRIASLQTLSELKVKRDDELFLNLLNDPSEEVRAFVLNEGFVRGFDDIKTIAVEAVAEEALIVARQAIRNLVDSNVTQLIEFWQNRELQVRPELWLDLYLALSSTDNPKAKQVAATYAAGDPSRVHALSLSGGSPLAGDLVFRNQGACMQCHQINGQGGVQGPELSLVGDRLHSDKLLESLVNPSAEITPGYGLSNFELVSGSSLVGRLVEENEEMLTVITPDGKDHQINENELVSISPPISAMPALGLTLSPVDLRDLIAYLGSRNKKDLAQLRRLQHGSKKQ